MSSEPLETETETETDSEREETDQTNRHCIPYHLLVK